MLKKDVVIGATYVVKVSEKLAPVRITEACSYGGWVGINTATGREVRIRSAQKLRRLLEPLSDVESRMRVDVVMVTCMKCGRNYNTRTGAQCPGCGKWPEVQS